MHFVNLDIVDSTQLYAKKWSHSFPKGEITCVSASAQTAGRGRYMRKWISPPRLNIYSTFYFTLPINSLHLSSLAQLMAYSLATLLIEDGIEPQIKWPNDIQLSGKKLSGVLCETTFREEEVDIFLGIGINVNSPPLILAQIDQPATSLLAETGHLWDKEEFLSRLQKRFSEHLEIFKTEGFTPFHKKFEHLLAFKGRTICCFDGKKEWVGVCHSMTKEGLLNLYLPDETVRTISAGDLNP